MDKTHVDALEYLVQRARTREEKLVDQIAALNAELAETRTERAVLEQATLRLLREQQGDDSQTLLSAPSQGDPWTMPAPVTEWMYLNQMDQVAKIMEEATEPLAPKDIQARLTAVGVDVDQDNTDPIRGALAYLRKKGRADRVGRGQWVLLGSAADRASRHGPEQSGDGASLRMSTDTEGPVATGPSSENQLHEEGGPAMS